MSLMSDSPCTPRLSAHALRPDPSSLPKRLCSVPALTLASISSSAGAQDVGKQGAVRVRGPEEPEPSTPGRLGALAPCCRWRSASLAELGESVQRSQAQQIRGRAGSSQSLIWWEHWGQHAGAMLGRTSEREGPSHCRSVGRQHLTESCSTSHTTALPRATAPWWSGSATTSPLGLSHCYLDPPLLSSQGPGSSGLAAGSPQIVKA